MCTVHDNACTVELRSCTAATLEICLEPTEVSGSLYMPSNVTYNMFQTLNSAYLNSARSS